MCIGYALEWIPRYPHVDHPALPEMAEPLEETRSEFIFATEPLLSSLYLSIPNSNHRSPIVELDEVEVSITSAFKCSLLMTAKQPSDPEGYPSSMQRSLLPAHLRTPDPFQPLTGKYPHYCCRQSAPCSHTLNIAELRAYCLCFVLQGDWKIGGLGLTIPLMHSDGQPTKWEFPTFDGRVMPYIQRSFDYMGMRLIFTRQGLFGELTMNCVAPEYALDEALNTASDLYSLGCLIYAVHCKGDPPFKTHGSLGGLRDAAGRPLTGISGLDRDLQGAEVSFTFVKTTLTPLLAMLNGLITRHPTNRLTSSSLPSHSFFSSLPISTLNFLDRSNFAAKSREEKISFMRGLTGVLDKFSVGLRVRKILPSLLEEVGVPFSSYYLGVLDVLSCR